MKAKLVFLLLMVISACAPIAAQTNAGLQQVTLYNPGMQTPGWDRSLRQGQSLPAPDLSRSAINFETGERGFRPSEAAHFDLNYGGVIIGEGDKRLPDWFRVTDSRSMIVDLGAKNWPDIRETPPFPKAGRHPPPPLANRPWVLDSSPGKEVSPYRQFIPVRPDHIYLMRILHGNKVIYAMFRVESLNPEESCVLSWKHVAPPKVDKEK
ncbi:MAG TPA: hypothetical protein VLQ90_09510 [Pyrinomonadaceae bacterium]|nr:hypothetical protein [Pyrinomonadaceae bacterium]